jgi:NADH-quinone oxidoreductase subunit L
MGISVLIAAAGWLLARAKYHALKTTPPAPETYTGVLKLLWNKYWVDEIYTRLIIRLLLTISEKLFLNTLDKGTIDGLANGSARGWQHLARWASLLQTGNIQAYGFYILIGTALVIGLSLLY